MTMILQRAMDVVAAEYGQRTHQVRALDGDQVLGHMRFQLLTQEDFEIEFPNVLWYLARIKGYNLYESCPVRRRVLLSDRDALLKAMAPLVGKSYKRANSAHQRLLDHSTLYDHYLASITTRFGEEFERFRAHVVDRPRVTWVSLKTSVDLSVATALMQDALQWVQALGYPLYRGAGYWHDEAYQHGWNTLKTQGFVEDTLEHDQGTHTFLIAA